MEIKIVKNAPVNNSKMRLSKWEAANQDIKDMLVLLFNEGNVEEDALFLDKERVFKNRKHSQPHPNELEVKDAVQAISQKSKIHFLKDISPIHKLSVRRSYDESGKFEGLYIKFKAK